jgi:hypothetical protein
MEEGRGRGAIREYRKSKKRLFLGYRVGYTEDNRQQTTENRQQSALIIQGKETLIANRNRLSGPVPTYCTEPNKYEE